MRTLVISDLHLGGRGRSDVLRHASMRAPLLEAIASAERLVLLGDTLEMRHGPVREPLAAARAFFCDLREALRPDAEVVLVPGNHDHELLSCWFERRARDRRPPVLGLEERIDSGVGEPLGTLARWLRPRRLRVAYPGLWLAPGVYATHGHYLDRHFTVPTFERLSVGALSRLARTELTARQTPDDYEAALAPLYALIHSMAQWAPPDRGVGRSSTAARVWGTLNARQGRLRVRSRAAQAGLALAVAGLNRTSVGPLRARVAPEDLRVAGLRAIAGVVDALGVDAEHVIFGHTHRSGPWPRDDSGEWRTAGGTRLLNTGSWTYERVFVTAKPGESPYWPGVGVWVEDGQPPRIERFLWDLALDGSGLLAHG